MAKLTKLKEFQPGRGYTKADWDEVSDDYESTDEELAQAKPMAEALPELHAALVAEIAGRKAGRPKLETPKRSIALRVDADVLEAFKATGPGWQTRMNAVLRAWAKKRRTAVL